MLDREEGFYKNKSQEEIIEMAVETMNTVIKTVDRAAKTVEKIPKSSKRVKDFKF